MPDIKIQPSYKKEDLEFLLKTFELADSHRDTERNFSVASLIVKDGRIVAEGYRKMFILRRDPFHDRTYHGEQMAITRARGRTNAEGATIYSTLEPCSTRIISTSGAIVSPCSQLIYEAGIKRVVLGSVDEDLVGKGGAQYLMQQGIEVFYCPEFDAKRFSYLTDNPIMPQGAKTSFDARRKKTEESKLNQRNN